ncbi:hypothetical protein LJR251_002747 [Rhizobium rhizogenes]|uniref:hypothetical protein n=1 Tax=Rhizobium rhizogenes TaxID=359 RepID=UPI003ECE3888
MARVRFTADFDYKPTPGITIAYKAGMQLLVKRDCADQAIAAGKAIDIYRKKDTTDGAKTISG